MTTQLELQAAADLLRNSEGQAMLAAKPILEKCIADLTTLIDGLAVTNPPSAAISFIQRMIGNTGATVSNEVASLLNMYGVSA